MRFVVTRFFEYYILQRSHSLSSGCSKLILLLKLLFNILSLQHVRSALLCSLQPRPEMGMVLTGNSQGINQF